MFRNPPDEAIDRFFDQVGKLFAICVVVAMCAFIAYFYNGIADRSAADYLRRGLERLSREDQEGAAADFNEAIALDPKFANAFYSRGKLRAKKGDAAGALSDFDRVIELHPESVFVGTAKKVSGQGPNSFDIPGHLGYVYKDRGRVQTSEGRLEAAIADFDQAIQYDAKDADAYYERGLAREKISGQGGDARKDFAEAARLSPGDPKFRAKIDGIKQSKNGD